MKCNNEEWGCEWVGTVRTLEEHVARCEFTLLPCPKRCKEDNDAVKHFMRKDHEKHLQKDCRNRDHECEYCGEKGTYATITEVHIQTCPKKTVPCPNPECGETMQRQEIDEHVFTKCRHTVISCKYKGIGCGIELKRGDMGAHEESDKHHLHVALETVNLQQAMLQRLNILKNNQIFVLSDYKKKKESSTSFQFPSFYTHPNGYHMQLEVHANGYNSSGRGVHVSVFTLILEGKYDAGLKWPFIGKVAITLLNQLEDENHRTQIRTFDATDNACATSVWGGRFIQQSELTQSANTQYLKDDTLYFRLSVEVANLKQWLVN